MISTGKGVEKILGRKGRRSGRKKANRERGERPKEGKGRSSQGGGRLEGEKGGKDLNRERGETILGRKGRRSGKALKGRGERISTGKGGQGS